MQRSRRSHLIFSNDQLVGSLIANVRQTEERKFQMNDNSSHIPMIEQMLQTYTCELFAILSLLTAIPETAKIQPTDVRRITENLISASPALQALSPQINERVSQILTVARTHQMMADLD